jgi:hypothetical protein
MCKKKLYEMYIFRVSGIVSFVHILHLHCIKYRSTCINLKIHWNLGPAEGLIFQENEITLNKFLLEEKKTLVSFSTAGGM